MKSDCAVYIDAGYLLAAAATTITGTSLRSGVVVNYEALLEHVIAEAERVTSLRVMRTQWYDAAPSGVPTPEQERIGMLPRVKLRLGRIGFDGQQKGVDLRIGLDMVSYARNGAVGTIVLVSGDDDLTVAVEEAQHQGVEVAILAVADGHSATHGVAKHLRLAADNLYLLDGELISAAVKKRVTPPPPVRTTTTEPNNAPVPQLDDPPVIASEPHQTEPQEVRSEVPAIPTPASIGIPTRNPRPSSDNSTRRNRSQMAYTSTTGGPTTVSPRFADEAIYEDEIVSVATRVVSSFLASADENARLDVFRNRPSIPQELDRALLLDLASKTDNYNLSDAVVRDLRREFWAQFGDESQALR